ncbi:prolipoprotein diacylglyceryl transferase [Anthocerotibacter panamensis]|uniref:prolipoprotein diacylglyceryl transferase n=1 Tax=Anthocerotibacter panamensis TaxID=2857077 RepID=UPI001C4080D0|nr:prolipoprotein diacylglyceryl transferase [Anthocerotibacter panamensis]
MDLLAFVFASPGPILVQLGPLTLRWYSVLVTGGIVLGTIFAQNLARKRGLNPDLVADLAVWVVVGAIPLARLYYVVFRWDLFQNNLWSIFAIWEGGIAIHGGILGGLIAGYLFCRRHGAPFWKLADVCSPGLILGQAIGRWGNFFNAEAFGDPTTLPWKLYIPPANRPALFAGFEYFHPTFLYESLWNLGVLGVLLLAFSRWPNAKPGTIAALYALCYSLGRFWVEGLRTDSLMLGPLRMAQVVSLLGIGLGLLGLWWFNRKHPVVS